MNNVSELIKSHRSIRKYLDKEIEEDILMDILEAGRWAPSSSHLQAYHVIRIKDPEKRKVIAAYAGDQKYIESCKEFVIFCGDLSRIKHVCEEEDVKFDGAYLELFLIASIDASLVAQNVLTAAESHGLGGVYIGGIRNEIAKVDELLQLPDFVVPLFGMCLGYPDQDPIKKPRLPMSIVYSEETYNEIDQDALDKYNDIVKSYYITRTKGKLNHNWSEYTSERLDGESRPHMLEYLKSKGFASK